MFIPLCNICSDRCLTFVVKCSLTVLLTIAWRSQAIQFLCYVRYSLTFTHTGLGGHTVHVVSVFWSTSSDKSETVVDEPDIHCTLACRLLIAEIPTPVRILLHDRLDRTSYTDLLQVDHSWKIKSVAVLPIFLVEKHRYVNMSNIKISYEFHRLHVHIHDHSQH